MRLLIVLHSLGIGGVERLTLQMLPRLKESFDVHILCLDEPGALAEMVQGASISCVHRVPGLRLKNIASVRKVITEVNPDIIHAHQYTPWFYASIGKLLSGSRAKLIFTEHGRHYPDIVSAKRRVMNKLLLTQTKRVTAVSTAIGAQLAARDGIPQEKIRIIRNGIIPSKATPVRLHRELQLSEDTFLYGFVGSLRPVKNPTLLVEAFKSFCRHHPELPSALVMIGDGVLRAELEARSSGAPIFFLGSRVPVEPYLKGLNAMILPSFSEGISLSLLEAMASCVPVIASRVGGNPEVIEDGVSGFLFPSGEVVALEECLKKVRDVNSELLSRAKERVKTHFSFEQMLTSYRELYAET